MCTVNFLSTTCHVRDYENYAFESFGHTQTLEALIKFVVLYRIRWSSINQLFTTMAIMIPKNLKGQFIYLPIDIKTRELDAMILLGCVLAERGANVFIGEKTIFQLHTFRIPRGTYLWKTVTVKSRKRYNRFHALGFSIAAIDEEGLVIYSREIYKTRRLDPEAVHLPDKLFAWGEENASILRDMLDEDEYSKIIITGNPRFDLLRDPLRNFYASKAEKIRKKYGRYILFNSNFHWVNTIIRSITRLPHPDDVASGKFPMPKFYNPELARFRIKLFREYLATLPKLARAFPDIHFVLRPHPAENEKAWKDAVKGIKNCTVVREGEVAPWILGSIAVLHHSCTTAVEAFVMGKPAISYRPFKHENMDPKLPIELSLQADNFKQLKNVVRSVETGSISKSFLKSKKHFLKKHLVSIDGPLACDRMADALLAMELPQKSLVKRFFAVSKAVIKITKRWIKEKRTGKRHERMLIELFPPTDLEEINSKIGHYRKLLNRFKNIEASELGTNFFWIKATEKNHAKHS